MDVGDEGANWRSTVFSTMVILIRKNVILKRHWSATFGSMFRHFLFAYRHSTGSEVFLLVVSKLLLVQLLSNFKPFNFIFILNG